MLISRVQNQVDEVVDIMQTNIGRVMERGDQLEDLQDKSGKNLYSIIDSICKVYYRKLRGYPLNKATTTV